MTYGGAHKVLTVPAGGDKSVNAVWTYEKPYPAFAQIKGHIAATLNVARELDAKLEAMLASAAA
jgi:uncharacterized protein (DUF427 family)